MKEKIDLINHIVAYSLAFGDFKDVKRCLAFEHFF